MSLGNATFELRADVSDLIAGVRRAERETCGLEGKNATIDLKADASNLTAGIRSAEVERRRLDGKNATLDLKADEGPLATALRRAETARARFDGADATLDIKADTGDVDRGLRGVVVQTNRLNGMDATVDLKGDARDLDRDLAEASRDLARLDGRDVTVDIKGDVRQLDQSIRHADRRSRGLLGGLGIAAAGAGAVVGAGLAGGIALGVGQAVKSAANYQTAMNLLQASSKASGAEMKALDQLAIALGNDLQLPGTSASDAAAAMLELNKAGLSVNDTMAAAKGVLQLSAAANIGNAEAAQYTANALNAFNLSGSEATRVADLLAGGANESAADVSSLGQGMQQAAASFQAAGLPIEDMVTTLGLMANAGIAGSDAGTSLKTALDRLRPSTDAAAQAMADLGVNAFNQKGEMLPLRDIIGQYTRALRPLSQEQRMAAISTIFGSDAQRAANIIFAQGVTQYDKMKEAVTAEGNAAQMAAARMKGLAGAWQGFLSTLETTILTSGRPLLEPLERGIKDVTAALADPEVQASIQRYAQALADNLSDGIEYLRDHEEELRNFAETAITTGQKVGEAAGDIAQAFLAIADSPLGTFLAENADGIAKLAAAYVIYNRVGSPAIQTTIGVSNAIRGIGDLGTKARGIESLGDATVRLGTAARGASAAMLGPAGLVVAIGAAALALGAMYVDKRSDDITRMGKEAGLSADQIARLGGEGATTGRKIDAAFTIQPLREWAVEMGLVRGGINDTVESLAGLNRQAQEQAPFIKPDQADRFHQAADAATRFAAAQGSTGTESQNAKGKVDDLSKGIDTLTGRQIGYRDIAADTQRVQSDLAFSTINLKGAFEGAEGAIARYGAALDKSNKERSLVGSQMSIIKEEIDRLTEAGQAVPDALRIAYTELSGRHQQLGTDMANTTAAIVNTGNRVEALKRIVDNLPQGKEVDIRLKDEDFQRRLGKLNEAQIDPKTGIAYLNDEDYRRKLNGVHGLRVDPKTGNIFANAQDYQNKANRIKGIRFDAKTGLIKANTTDFDNKKRRIDNTRIAPKNARFTATTRDFDAEFLRINGVRVPLKSVQFGADTAFFYASYNRIAQLPNISKTVIIEELYRRRAGTGSAYSGQTGRAGGGAVYAGENYWTGEMGMEAFIPAIDGRILSHRDSMRALAGSTTTNNNNRAGDTILVNATSPQEAARQVKRELDYRTTMRRLQGGSGGL